jgi:putative membrane protein insertion efficiency factor
MLIRGLILFLIRAYQLLVSPLLGPSCRFQPTCSVYAVECVTRFGALRGSWMALKRLARCHPLGGHGYDPPPQLLAGETKETQ